MASSNNKSPDSGPKRKRKKTKIDDGFYPNLVVGARLDGYMGIPMLMDLKNASVPDAIVPFDRIGSEAAKGHTRAYVGFYLFDDKFAEIITCIDDYVETLKLFDGVITPDCTLLTGQANCLQGTNTYFNRAVGFYLQKRGIPVIPQIRWSDEQSYDYCFLGVPRKSIVAVSTYGCIQSKEKKQSFRKGFQAMTEALEPEDVIVHGPMPDEVFAGFMGSIRLHHFDDWTKVRHKKDGGE